MRLTRPVAAASAGFVLASAALTGAAVAAPAAAGTSAPVTGASTSSLDLIRLALAGHTLSTVGLSAATSTVQRMQSSLSLVPAALDNTSFGAVSVTPSSGSRTIGAQSAAVPGLADLTSPALTLAATTPASGPVATAGSTSLGSASLLGLPVAVNGTLQVLSSTTTDAVAGKTLMVNNLALPSIGSLLAALGLNLPALPVGTLNQLAGVLNLTSPALSAAQSALSAASAAVGNAPTTLAGATALVSSATSTLSADQTALTSAQATLTSATATLSSATATLTSSLNSIPAATLALVGLSSPPTISAFEALSSAVQTTLETATPGLASAYSSYLSAVSAASAAQTAVTAAQAAVAAAQAALTAAQNLLAAISALGTVVSGLLGNLPLVSIGRIDVATLADAGPHLAATVTGTVSGVKVLGTDVLSTLTGSTTADLTTVLGLSSQVQNAISTVTGALSSVLSTVPGFALTVPAPQVSVLAKSTGTSKNSAGDSAHADVTVLSVTIPSISLPSALALPGAGSLPLALIRSRATLSGLLSTPAISAVVGSMADTAATLTPAAPTGVTPAAAPPAAGAAPVSTPAAGPQATLPFTGLNTDVTLAGLVLLGVAAAVRKLRASATR